MYAHTPNERGVWHLLTDHAEGVARRAAEFAAPLGLADLAYWTGLWHDLGKANPRFQEYLQACAMGRMAQTVPHAIVGAIWAAAKLGAEAGLAIAGHHSGLPAWADLSARLRAAQKEEEVRQGLLAARDAGMPLRPAAVPTPPADDELGRELRIRMLFSALVDADWLDTEEHFAAERSELRNSETPSLAVLWERFEANQEELLRRSPPTPVNAVRAEVYRTAVAAAVQAPGLFRLTVPTGGGKTRTGLAFALRHALTHGLRRVVVAIPYTSIIEQTADVYRKILGPESVLEHHSAVVWPEGEGYDPASERLKLAAENWDTPLIVTTTVQLFESLFSNRPAACRKLHNLARSVIILDEVQTLPVELLRPTLDVVRHLVTDYGCTVVLCTATQPALAGESPYLSELSGLQVREIVPDPHRLFERLRRVQYDVRPQEVTWSEVADWMAAEPQALAIVNSRRDALRLVELLPEEGTYHLSTLLCGAHRRQVLAQVKAALKEKRPVRLCSTQIVEAGVDLDFPVVLRAIGPLDRIVQAAGRCNREGRLETGRVIVFTPADGGAPRGSYTTAMAVAAEFLNEGVDLDDPATYTRYFRRLYQGRNLDEPGVQALRRALNYPEVAARYRLIREDTVPVVVLYPPEREQVEGLLARARRDGMSRSLWRLLQPYTVNLFRYELIRAERSQLVEPLMPGLYIWRGKYDLVRGLVWDGAPFADPSDLII